MISVCQISENCEKQPDSSHCQSTRRRNSQPLDDLKQTSLSLTDKIWHEPLEKLDRPLLSKDNTNQLIDQCMGDSVEIPRQPILKLRNKPDKSNSHLRPRVKRDGSGVCSSPRFGFIHTVICILEISILFNAVILKKNYSKDWILSFWSYFSAQILSELRWGVSSTLLLVLLLSSTFFLLS